VTRRAGCGEAVPPDDVPERADRVGAAEGSTLAGVGVVGVGT